MQSLHSLIKRSKFTFGKNVGFFVISSSDVNCVATETKPRFSVRGFGRAPFYLNFFNSSLI